ncbi:hypothetical protein ACE01N_17740 [Saccharicrinis sp. FJH2]|uniref:hypothetical protein n=1 Tax=Saccharicrinis sp. FJH65 TaxID=3344659 RepID=UPI0035F31B96
MPLKDALKKLDDAVKDLTSLHVQTFTGQIETNVDSATSFDDIKKLINAEADKTDGKIKLVAESLAQFDGDSYNFVREDLDNVPPLALEVHKNAVKAGIETRLGLLNLFKDLIAKP